MTPSEVSQHFNDAIDNRDRWIVIADFERGIEDLEVIGGAAIVAGVVPDEMYYQRVRFTPKVVPVTQSIAWLSIPKDQFGYDDLYETLVYGGMPHKALRDTSVFVILTDSTEGPGLKFLHATISNNVIDAVAHLN